MFKTKYELLKNRDWLYQEYIVNKKGLNELQLIVGCKNHNSVRQALIHCDIPIRNNSEGLRINNEPINLDDEIITGCLLGDAGLRKANKFSEKSQAFFYKKNKYLDHVEFIAKYFYDDYKNYIVKDYNTCNGKLFTYYKFSTRAYESLNDYFNRWYPKSNDYKKLIPKDINITEKVLLHWFLDDGCSVYRNRQNEYPDNWTQNKKQVRIFLCTDCFSFKDQERMCKQINEKFQLEARVKKYMKTFRIFIPQSQSNNFFDVIGPCPVESLSYKWKIV